VKHDTEYISFCQPDPAEPANASLRSRGSPRVARFPASSRAAGATPPTRCIKARLPCAIVRVQVGQEAARLPWSLSRQVTPPAQQGQIVASKPGPGRPGQGGAVLSLRGTPTGARDTIHRRRLRSQTCLELGFRGASGPRHRRSIIRRRTIVARPMPPDAECRPRRTPPQCQRLDCDGAMIVEAFKPGAGAVARARAEEGDRGSRAGRTAL
jgi:hypothetical protein